jgi:L,D-peptidoglycan transpeptidase YkuD (ErfK/YbiS/YcfS/YnhG family)
MNIIHKKIYNTFNMIIVKKTGYLRFKNLKFKCALGKAGIKKKNKEGDNITPNGEFKIIKIYYREDRIKKFKTQIKKLKIKKNMGWCDDPNSPNYNRLIKIPNKYKYEKLYRKDNVYDLIMAINYNMNPIIKKKGSAIFIHVASKNFKKTAGCIALKRDDLILLASVVRKNQKIYIH